jgi:hypothetical protein
MGKILKPAKPGKHFPNIRRSASARRPKGTSATR